MSSLLIGAESTQPPAPGSFNDRGFIFVSFNGQPQISDCRALLIMAASLACNDPHERITLLINHWTADKLHQEKS